MRSGVQRQRPLRSPQWPHGHGRVAFLPWVPVRLKCLRPKEAAIELRTLGDHIRARRLHLRLTQCTAAERLGVSAWTVLNWERAKTEVPVQAVPAVIRFLGYDPYPAPTTLTERMQAKRRHMGWSIQDAAQALGVDAGTWGAWEAGVVKPWPRYQALLDRFLGYGV